MEAVLPRKIRTETTAGRPARSFTKELAESWQRELPDIDSTQLLTQIYIMRLGRMLDSAYDRLCREMVGISGAEMRVLFALRRAGPDAARRPTDLFRALLVTSGAMTKQIDRLQQGGYVVRLPDPSFGGGFLIKLTRKGKTASERTVRTLATKGLMSEALRVMSEGDLEELKRLCETFLVALETTPAPG
jgi:DNA-binding MarR family transcriptional regulator